MSLDFAPDSETPVPIKRRFEDEALERSGSETRRGRKVDLSGKILGLQRKVPMQVAATSILSYRCRWDRLLAKSFEITRQTTPRQGHQLVGRIKRWAKTFHRRRARLRSGGSTRDYRTRSRRESARQSWYGSFLDLTRRLLWLDLAL